MLLGSNGTISRPSRWNACTAEFIAGPPDNPSVKFHSSSWAMKKKVATVPVVQIKMLSSKIKRSRIWILLLPHIRISCSSVQVLRTVTGIFDSHRSKIASTGAPGFRINPGWTWSNLFFLLSEELTKRRYPSDETNFCAGSATAQDLNKSGTQESGDLFWPLWMHLLLYGDSKTGWVDFKLCFHIVSNFLRIRHIAIWWYIGSSSEDSETSEKSHMNLKP